MFEKEDPFPDEEDEGKASGKAHGGPGGVGVGGIKIKEATENCRDEIGEALLKSFGIRPPEPSTGDSVVKKGKYGEDPHPDADIQKSGLLVRHRAADQPHQKGHQADLLLFGMPNSYRLLQALKTARQRGLPVRVLVTPETFARYRPEVLALTAARVPVRILPENLPTYIRPMALFDRRVLLYGSGGWGSLSPDGGGQMHMLANLLSQGRIHASQKLFDTLWLQSISAGKSGTQTPP